MQTHKREVVATIPMDPSHAGKVGFYSIFVYVQKYAQVHAIHSVCGINVLGKEVCGTNISLLRETLEKLRAKPSVWWVDEALQTSMVLQRIRELYEAGFLEKGVREVSSCSCGNVEYLSRNVLRGSKTLIQGNRAKCCDSLITKSEEEVLLTAPLPYAHVRDVYPTWAGRELVEKCTRITGNQLLVSRKSKRKYWLQLSTKLWYIDNDISWWLYPEWLDKQDFSLKHLVVGCSILHQASILLSFSTLIGAPPIQSLHCLPKVYYQSGTRAKTIAEAVSSFGTTKVVNALLWCALSERKEITFLENMFNSMTSDEQQHCSSEKRKLMRM